MDKVKELLEKYKLDKKSWYCKGAHSILHTMFPASINLLKPLKEYYGEGMNLFLIYIDGNEVVKYCYCEEEMVKLRESIIEKVNNNPKFLEEYVGEWKGRVGLFIEVCNKVENKNLEELNNEELLSLYEELYESYIYEYALAMAIPESFSLHSDKFIEPYFEKIMKEKGKEKLFYEYYAVLMAPVRSSFVEEEQRDLLKILEYWNSKSLGTEELLEKHQKKYFWIRNNYAVQKILDKEFFRKELEVIKRDDLDPRKELNEIEERYVKIKEKKNEIIEELGLGQDKKLMNLIKMVEEFAALQDERKKCVLLSSHYQRLFMNEISKRLNLSKDEIEYTIYPELKKMLLDKNMDRKKLRKRKEHCTCIFTQEGYELLEGEVSKKLCDKIFKKTFDEIRELKGTVASIGKSIGKVKIVKTIYEIEKVQKGDILVANMTRPEMVVAMKKAGAIVTDEGGITSHAAVVSRELGIPCIVGTRNATEVFKDGELVEVDATNGIVRKK